MENQTATPKAYLEAAQMATFLRAPETANAKKFVSALTDQTLEHEAVTTPRQRKRRTKDMEFFEKAIAAFAADLIEHNESYASDGYLYRSSDREALSETLVSSRHFEQLITFWNDMEFLEMTGYFRAKTDFEGPTNDAFMTRARRIRATPKLMQMAESFNIHSDNINEHFPQQSHLISLVTVRSETKRKNGVKRKAANVKVRGAGYDDQVATMKALNAVYPKHSFSLADTPRLYRLFNRGD